MKRHRHCTAAILAALVLLAGRSAAGQTRTAQAQPGTPATGEATYVVFFGGREVGREQVNLSRTATGWTVMSSGRLGPPLNFDIRRFELTYTPDWQPLELKIDAAVQENALTVTTSFTTTSAINEITQKGVTNSKTDQVSARTIVLPNNFYAAYEALAVRLASAKEGDEIPTYVAPQTEIRLRVRSVATTMYETAGGQVATRKYGVTFANPSGPLEAEISVDDRQRFARLDIAGAGLTVVRDDIAGVSSRQQTHKNPTDAPVRIPASGFGLAGTITTPTVPGTLKHPAIVLVPGSGPIDRDATVAGIPIFAQLAGQLAELGFVVLRYDKRGIGQSGGRTERVTLQDYAEDAIAAVKWIGKRKDVDNSRITLVGHSEGAAIGMLAAAREKKISALVLIAGPGTTGRELLLEQQATALTQAKTGDAERQQKVDLQNRIMDAAIAQKGLDELPEPYRDAAELPLFRSILTFDPSKVMPRIRQPVLILQGSLDQQVPTHHGEKLLALAQARDDNRPASLKTFEGLNHLLVPAKTGHVSEYTALDVKAVSPEIAKTIAEWLPTVARRR